MSIEEKILCDLTEGHLELRIKFSS